MGPATDGQPEPLPVPATGNLGVAKRVEPKFVPLFNGKDLDGWKNIADPRTNWRASSGVLMGTGPGAPCIGFIATEKSFRHFHLRTKAMLSTDRNGSINFSDRWRVMISDSTPGGIATTGDLWWDRTVIVDAPTPDVRPEEWFSVDLIAYHRRIVVRINGKLMVDHQCTEDIQSGPIALMCLAGGTVRYKELEIREFADDIPDADVFGAVQIPKAGKATLLSGFREIEAPSSWLIRGDELHQTAKVGGWEQFPNLVFGDAKWSEYDLTVKVKASDVGGGGVGVVFHQQKPGDCCYLTLGSYGNRGSDLSFLNDGKWSRPNGAYRPGAIEPDQWYAVRIVARGNSCECWVDGVKWFRCDDLPFQQGQVGFRTWGSICQFKDVVIKSPEGKVLWSGLPDVNSPRIENKEPGPNNGQQMKIVIQNDYYETKKVIQNNQNNQPVDPKTEPHKRILVGEDARTATKLEQRINDLGSKGDIVGLIKAAEELLVMRTKHQGEDHYQTINVKYDLVAYRKFAILPPEKLHEWRAAVRESQGAKQLEDRGQYAEALLKRQTYLKSCLEILGDNHPYTGNGYNSLAFNLKRQGKYAEAQPLFQKALEIRRKVLGDEHPSTADSYNNIALNLDVQGKYSETPRLFLKSLDICLKVFGDEHPNTATIYNNVAIHLKVTGRYAEAHPYFQRALDIYRKVLGEEHYLTADGYNNIAMNLNAHGQYADAQPLLLKSLEIRRKVLGELHPDTAGSYSNVAWNLDDQGKHAEAYPLYHKALEIRRKVLGDEHPSTADSYSNLAPIPFV